MASPKPTLVIAGAGPQLGMAIARKFGAEGFRVGLIARRDTALAEYVETLEELGVEAAGAVADLSDHEQVAGAFAELRDQVGDADVMVFSPRLAPGPVTDAPITPSRLTDTAVLPHFSLVVLGALYCVEEVLPAMRAKGSGSMFFTTGTSAVRPMPVIVGPGIAVSGLRNYAICLHEELAPEGIYVCHVPICLQINGGRGPRDDADAIAATYYGLHLSRDRAEEVYEL